MADLCQVQFKLRQDMLYLVYQPVCVATVITSYQVTSDMPGKLNFQVYLLSWTEVREEGVAATLAVARWLGSQLCYLYPLLASLLC